MKFDHPALAELLQRAYSAEKAAAFAYIGHAGSLKNQDEKIAVKQIEDDEWGHRKNVLVIMNQYDIPISKWYEIKFHIIGRVISASCHVIGWFMPYFFAGKLESGNVCEYFVMMHYFHSLGLREHDQILYEMGMKEKEHEIYFLNQVANSKLLPVFEKVFAWGKKSSLNDVDLENKYSVEKSKEYCKTYKAHASKP
jgi:rubrerythrin